MVCARGRLGANLLFVPGWRLGYLTVGKASGTMCERASLASSEHCGDDSAWPEVSDLGMPLLSVNRVEPGQADASDVKQQMRQDNDAWKGGLPL